MSEERKKALMLLKTARGQIDGIIKMIDDGRYCIDVSNQILASQSLIKKANLEVLKGHLNHCVKDACEANKSEVDEKIKEINSILEKIICK